MTADASVRARIKFINGATAASLSAWLSIPKGPSDKVKHSMGGNPSTRKDIIAALRPAVTAEFEFGLMTRIGPITLNLLQNSDLVLTLGRIVPDVQSNQFVTF